MTPQTAKVFARIYAVFMWIVALTMLLVAVTLLFLGGVASGVFLNIADTLPLFGGALQAITIMVSILFVLVALFYGFIGHGMWRYREWARVATVIMCFLALFLFPYGTIIGAGGIYLFWFDKSTKKIFTKRVKRGKK